jgi:tRNA nucleotidyltransferase (CCA-adding enzyme)
VLAAALGRGVAEATELASFQPARPSEAVDRAHGRSGVELALARALGAEWLDRYVAEWRDVRLEIDGNDLLAEGIGEGPRVGRGLHEALRAKLDGEVHGADEELRAALAAARQNAT